MSYPHCFYGDEHVAGDDDTFAFCGKKKSKEEREKVAIEKGAKLLHTDSKFKYFKVPVAKGKKMKWGRTHLGNPSKKKCEKFHLPTDKKCGNFLIFFQTRSTRPIDAKI